jgi:hypothetical protein
VELALEQDRESKSFRIGSDVTRGHNKFSECPSNQGRGSRRSRDEHAPPGAVPDPGLEPAGRGDEEDGLTVMSVHQETTWFPQPRLRLRPLLVRFGSGQGSQVVVTKRMAADRLSVQETHVVPEATVGRLRPLVCPSRAGTTGRGDEEDG